MIRITLKIEGMMCGMCESHINDTIRRELNVDKVTSSRSKKESVIIAKDDIENEKIRACVAKTGYELINITKEPYEKRSFFGFLKRK
ncbi:MAG: heavy-metal-associated domain-containing protein [Clostridia bacterium]|nr:heavy-metal-associated domain-containing protein [Clostridia bacterium]MBO5092033.1 heavy-metal-associated domain-containing protein [Clostridia bacterium]MBP3494651.1 heavy-metal-associated domain-containing protein [Clostridia bacterium]MBQ7788544.1 heavy-metal-associated domain-containing protein [Clostridia bacterium]